MLAKSQGYKLNEYGLFKIIEKDGKTVEKFIIKNATSLPLRRSTRRPVGV
mgnify:CR=1 FL=1